MASESNVIPFPQSEADDIARLAKLPLSTLYQMRRMAIDEADLEWAALIDEAVKHAYGR